MKKKQNTPVNPMGDDYSEADESCCKTSSSCCDTTTSCCMTQNGALPFVIALLLVVNIVASFFVYKEASTAPEREVASLMQMSNVEDYRRYKTIMASDTSSQTMIKEKLDEMEKQIQAKNNTGAAKTPAATDTPATETEPSTQPEPPVQPAATTAPKADKPTADLFIMSYCPYGLQAQKGYLEIIEKLGGVADINVKFVHYLMHGADERDENTRQYCIQKDQKTKYVAYTKCFAEAGKSTDCLKTAGVDETQLSGCMTLINDRYKVMEDFAAGGQYPKYGVNAEESQKFGVQGSPTFVLNGVKMDNVGRDAASYAKAICDSFTTKPEVCNQTFASTTFDPMFGWTSNGSSANANCGN